MRVRACVRVRVCARVCVCACVRVCVRARARASLRERSTRRTQPYHNVFDVPCNHINAVEHGHSKAPLEYSPSSGRDHGSAVTSHTARRSTGERVKRVQKKVDTDTECVRVCVRVCVCVRVRPVCAQLTLGKRPTVGMRQLLWSMICCSPAWFAQAVVQW